MTGRSPTEPNLQNIPIRTPEANAIRKAFASKRPFVMQANYSQIELRVLAYMEAEDENKQRDR